MSSFISESIVMMYKQHDYHITVDALVYILTQNLRLSFCFSAICQLYRWWVSVGRDLWINRWKRKISRPFILFQFFLLPFSSILHKNKGTICQSFIVRERKFIINCFYSCCCCFFGSGWNRVIVDFFRTNENVCLALIKHTNTSTTVSHPIPPCSTWSYSPTVLQDCMNKTMNN